VGTVKFCDQIFSGHFTGSYEFCVENEGYVLDKTTLLFGWLLASIFFFSLSSFLFLFFIFLSFLPLCRHLFVCLFSHLMMMMMMTTMTAAATVRMMVITRVM
jgi:hypothetical protein